MKTKCLGGSLLVLKGLNDCVTIARGKDGQPHIESVEGDWTKEELNEASEFWEGSEAEKR